MGALGAAVVVGLVVSLLVKLWRRYVDVKAAIDRIHGPRAFPIIGNVHQFKTQPDDFFEQICGVSAMYQTPRMLRIWMMWKPYVLIYGAQEAEAVLSSNRNIDKAGEYSLLHPWLGLGLLTSYAEKWRPRRKLLTPTFHYDILKEYVEVYVSQTKTLIGKLNEVEGGGPVDVYPYVTLAALDIICETAMGKDLRAQHLRDSDYVRAVYKINEIVHERQKKPWLWPNFMFQLFGRGKEHAWCLKVLHGFTNGVIEDRVRERAVSRELNNNTSQHTAERGKGQKGRQAFLDLLLGMVEEGLMPMEDVRSEVDTFMFEGHDTTSAGLNWTLHLLANSPSVQAKVQAEVDAVFGEEERDLSYEDLKNLVYLECVVKEALRLFPSVPIFARTLGADATVAGYTVPKGTTVTVLPFVVHRDPLHWPDPFAFDPDRFLPDRAKNRHPYAYLPFSAGSRNCIGLKLEKLLEVSFEGQRFALMEEKAVMAMLIRYFNLSSPHRRDHVRPKGELILRPIQGVHLKLERRRPIPSHFHLSH